MSNDIYFIYFESMGPWPFLECKEAFYCTGAPVWVVESNTGAGWWALAGFEQALGEFVHFLGIDGEIQFLTIPQCVKHGYRLYQPSFTAPGKPS